MIHGIGLDLIEISRIEKAMRDPRFVERILTLAEREYCTSPERVAGRWAAKEAFAKCMAGQHRWHDVEILPDEHGKPILTHLASKNGIRYHVTISHARTVAAAVVIAEL